MQVVVERRRRVTHAGHRERIVATGILVHRKMLLLVMRLVVLLMLESLLLRIVLVRMMLMVVIVRGITYILIITVTVVSHLRLLLLRTLAGHLQILESVREVRFANHFRPIGHAPVVMLLRVVLHHWDHVVRSTSTTATTKASSSSSSTAVVTPVAMLVLLVVWQTELWLLLWRRDRFLRNEFGGIHRQTGYRLCTTSGSSERSEARFRTGLPVATSTLLIHLAAAILLSMLLVVGVQFLSGSGSLQLSQSPTLSPADSESRSPPRRSALTARNARIKEAENV